MAFIETSETIQSRLHLGDLSPRKIILLLIALSVVVAVLATTLVSAFRTPEISITHESQSDTSSQTNEPLEGLSEPSGASVTTDVIGDEALIGEICVHISGCVEMPGVYSLPDGSRVHDAIRAAGGFSGEAAEGYLNEARILSDGEHVVVPSIVEVAESEQGQTPLWMNGGVAGVISDTKDKLVNINTASLDLLITLDGIGEATAKKIIADREEKGPFTTPEDLMRVSGIGEKKFAVIADSICV